MTDNKLRNIGLRLLEIGAKDNYEIVVYEVIIHIAYSIFAGRFENYDIITYHTLKNDKNVDQIKKIFKKAGLKVKTKLIKDSKEYDEMEYDKGYRIYEYQLSSNIKYKNVKNRFEILDL